MAALIHHDGWSEEFGFWVLVPVFVGDDLDFDDDCDWGNRDWDDCEGPVCLID